MKTYFALVSIFLISILSANIDIHNQNYLLKRGITEEYHDIFFKTFGAFKDYLSYMSFLRADIYFHGGVYDFPPHEHDQEEALHIIEESEHHKEGAHAHEESHIQHHGHIFGDIKPSINILLDIGKASHIRSHRHLSGKEEKEIMPWIHYATRIDPHNEIAYVVGGFWLVKKLDKIDKGIEFLKDGLMHNPQSWEIYQTLGQIYFLDKKELDRAKIYLERAQRLVEKQDADKFDKRSVYTFLSEIYIRAGEEEKARLIFKKILDLFPNDKIIENRLRAMSS